MGTHKHFVDLSNPKVADVFKGYSQKDIRKYAVYWCPCPSCRDYMARLQVQRMLDYGVPPKRWPRVSNQTVKALADCHPGLLDALETPETDGFNPKRKFNLKNRGRCPHKLYDPKERKAV